MASDSSLSQGDILTGVKLHLTSAEGNVKWHKASQIALVISRPCAATNKERILLASIEPFEVPLASKLMENTKNLAELKKKLESIRDADGSDSFYVGSLWWTEGDKRYAARLDLITTVQVPTDKTEREGWVKKHRVASLDPEFRRDLHTRLFLSFARQGFNDSRWFANRDLDLLLQFGETQKQSATLAISSAKLEIQGAKASGKYPQQRKGLDKTLEDALKAQREAESELEPLLNEKARRTAEPIGDEQQLD